MVDNDGDFTSGVTLSSPTSIDAVKKTVTYRVNLNDTQYFTLGSIEKYALPITLVSFDAQNIDNKKVNVNWVTASEEGNSFYTIERSSNGKDFSDIGYVSGAGNSETTLTYSFTDAKPLFGVSYYRLKQTDFNGEFEHSEVVRVFVDKVTELKTEFGVYPNPALFGEEIKLAYKVDFDQTIKVEVHNASGVVQSKRLLKIKASDEYITLGAEGFQRGLNLIRIIDSDRNIRTIKLLVH